MKFGIGVLDTWPSSTCELHENRHNDSRTLLRGVNEFRPAISTFIGPFGWSPIQDVHVTPLGRC